MFTRTVFIFIFLHASLALLAQPAEYKMTRVEYVDKYKDDAVKEMLMHGVPASITLAQGMLESGNGNSALAMYANNHFGIKCHDEWNGMTYTHDDDANNECFRKYNSVLESFSDHSMFLKSRDRYAFLFDLKINDYKGWAYGLKAAGYATDPNYADKLIQIIEGYGLNELDKMAIMPMTRPEVEVKDMPPITKNPTTKILLNNNIKYVIAKPGDSYFTIAQQLDMGLWQLYKYNESGKSSSIKSGDIVYLQPKKRRSAQQFHFVKKGDTMYSISQHYGIKLKYLYRKNLMNPGDEPKVGDTINLRKKKKS